VNFAEPSRPGSDFWPGQYQKTYVFARKTYDDVLDALREGRVFTSTMELEPSMDPPGEDPWSDLWVYSNPIFLEIR
jgi:hypothetical protein